MRNLVLLLIFVVSLPNCKSSSKNKSGKTNTQIKKNIVQKPVSKTKKKKNYKHRLRKLSNANKKIARQPLKFFAIQPQKLPRPSSQLYTALQADVFGNKKPRVIYISNKKIEILSEDLKKIEVTQSLPAFKGIYTVYFNSKIKKEAIIGAWKRSGNSKCIIVAEYHIEKNKLKASVINSKLCGQPNDARYIRPTDLKISEDSIFLAYHDGKYSVKVIKQNLKTSKTEEIITRNMIQAIYPVKDGIFIERLYGDKPGSNGDIFFLSGSKKQVIPSERGGRALLITKDKSDLKIFAGDGWHKNYGKIAKANLIEIIKTPKGFIRKKIDELKNDIAVFSINYADLDGNGSKDLIVKGNNSLIAYMNPGFKKLKLANISSSKPVTIIKRKNTNKHDILVFEPYPMILSLKDSKHK